MKSPGSSGILLNKINQVLLRRSKIKYFLALYLALVGASFYQGVVDQAFVTLNQAILAF